MTPRTCWLTLVALAAGCGEDPTGTCTGTYDGVTADWEIDADTTSYRKRISERYGTEYRYADLVWAADGFVLGVDLELDPNRAIGKSEPSYLTTLDEEGNIVASENPIVTAWQGLSGDSNSYGNGWREPPGAPQQGALTTEVLDDERFEGRLALSWAEGSEIACTFAVPQE